MITINTCVYCEETKKVTVWEQTGELVCYDCRLNMLDEEFKDIYQEEIHNELIRNLFREPQPKLLPNNKVDCTTRTAIL